MKKNYIQIWILIWLVMPTMFLWSCEPNSVEVEAPNAFLKFYGGGEQQEGLSLKQTPDGGFIMLGSTNSFGHGGWDIYLIKVDRAGNEEWSNTYGGVGNDRGKSLLVEDDGSYIVLGDYQRVEVNQSEIKMHIDMYLLKISATGQQIDSAFFGNNGSGKEYSNEIGSEVQKTADGGYVIVGSTTNWDITGDTPEDSIANAPTDFYLVKTINGFELDWENAKGFPGEDIANSVVQFDDSTFLITGSTKDGTQGDKDLFVSKIRKKGVTIDKRNFGGSETDVGNRIIKTDGGYAVIGTSEESGKKNILLVNILIEGSQLNGVEKIVDSKIGTSSNEGNDIVQLPDGNYLILGTATSAGDKNFYLVKTGNSGWERKIGGEGMDEGHAVITTENGFVLLGNSTFEGTSNTMINLIKTNKKGELIR